MEEISQVFQVYTSNKVKENIPYFSFILKPQSVFSYSHVLQVIVFSGKRFTSVIEG